jgi:ubiquinone/menaquinone biosynthesis C-methylase UbiE
MSHSGRNMNQHESYVTVQPAISQERVLAQIADHKGGRKEPGLATRQAHWNSRASSYDTDFSCAPVRARILDEVIALTPHQARMVIDAGTGTGRTLRRLRTHLDSTARVIGLDFSMEMLKQTKRRSANQARLPAMVQADHAALPFRSASADVIISTFTLHHIPPSQQLRVLQEFRRVLADGGSLIIADQVQPDPPASPAQMKKMIARTFYPHLAEDDGIKKLSSYGEWPLQVDLLADLIQQEGFRPVLIHRINSIIAVLQAMVPEPHRMARGGTGRVHPQRPSRNSPAVPALGQSSRSREGRLRRRQ